ncbi:MAG: ABC transporter ATP-binding protein [Microbacterium sp.]|uniref:ABC transporter ATP-binding protein n=1 Tax=Microbacterium sp. TaxID=51671 RepID=UPI0039E6A1A8
MSDTTNPSPLLQVAGLRAYLGSPRGVVKAVDDVSFAIARGEGMGLVGESGSGKSVMAKAIMGLLPWRSDRTGSVLFKGRELLTTSRKEMREIWGTQISLVFQDPRRALNPVVKVERQLTEGLRKRLGLGRSEARDRALQLLAEVGVSDPEQRLGNYPHELSGGMAQRVMIAIALSCEPELLIADEPTTALDVTIQRQILDLLREVQRNRGMSMILISHDLSLVAGRTDRVSVMYAGRMAENGPTREVFAQPRHRYSEALLATTPTLEHERHTPFELIPGWLPDPVEPPPGCRFAARCSYATADCTMPGPATTEIGAGHYVVCNHPAGAPAQKKDGELIGR